MTPSTTSPLLTWSLRIHPFINEHKPLVRCLVLNTHVIQHVLRHNVIHKVSDQINITPLLSIITYFYMSYTKFNVMKHLIHYIKSLTIIKNPKSKINYNLTLGHMIDHLLKVKYNLTYPKDPNYIHFFTS